MTENRSTYRVRLADLLRVRLNGLAQAVYAYQVADFKGMSPVVLVTGSGTQRGDPLTSENSSFVYDIHVFVLYALFPLVAENSPEAGDDVDIAFTDTSMFSVGQEVFIEDASYSEKAVITVVTTDVSITIGTLVNSYETPKVHIWTEENSEDMIDLLEYTISDEVRLANDQDMGLFIRPEGQSEVDAVDIGGDGYRHETITVRVGAPDY